MNLRAAVGSLALLAALLGTALLTRRNHPRSKPPASPAEVSFLEVPTDFLRDIEKSETLADLAGASVKSTLMKGVREGNWGLAATALEPDFKARFPGPGDGRSISDGSVSVRSFESGTETDAEGFLAVIRAHVADWTAVERTTWRTFEFRAAPDESGAYLRVHFQIAGPRVDRTRCDLQATLGAQLVRRQNGWKLRRLAIEDGYRVEAKIGPFLDVSDLTGFHWNESEQNRRNLQDVINVRGPATNGALAVVDWNHDDRPDLLATLANKQAVLFLNDGKGGFTRTDLPFKTAEEAGWVVLFVDLDGDGLEEIVTGKVLQHDVDTAWLGLYTRRDGAWVLRTDSLRMPVPAGFRDLITSTIGAADINADGLLDLFVGYYSDNKSRGDDFNAISAYDGADDALFVNKGNLSFSEESDARGIVSTQYTLAHAFFDLDSDGDQDLIQCNDFGPNIYWENQGDGFFVEKRDHFLARGSAYTMGISIADYDNSGRWSIHISNMYSHAGNRILTLVDRLGPDMLARTRAMAAGNWHYERDPSSGAWKEVSRERGVDQADWAWACLFLDVDNDRDKDLFVTNGYTSHEDPSAPDY